MVVQDEGGGDREKRFCGGCWCGGACWVRTGDGGVGEGDNGLACGGGAIPGKINLGGVTRDGVCGYRHRGMYRRGCGCNGGWCQRVG